MQLPMDIRVHPLSQEDLSVCSSVFGCLHRVTTSPSERSWWEGPQSASATLTHRFLFVHSQVKSEPTAEAEVKSPGSLCAVSLGNEKGHKADPQASDDSLHPQAETHQQRRPSSPSKPAGSPSQSVNGHSPSPVNPGSASASHGQQATGSVSGSQIPSKARGHHSRGSVISRPTQRARLPSTSLGPSQVPTRSGGASQPAGRALGSTRTTGRSPGTNQQTSQVTAPGQPAGRSVVTTNTSAPTSTQRVSVSNQGSPRAQSPSTPPDPNQAGSKAPSEPGDGGFRNDKQGQKIPAMQEAPGSSALEQVVPCHSDSSLEYVSESTTEITCKWGGYSHHLHCPRHLWLLQHLAY